MEQSSVAGLAVGLDEPRLYPPAASSRFLAWVDGLPLHGWWVFPGLLVLQLVSSHAVLWASGLIPAGTFDPVIGFGAVYGPYTLAALSWINRVARGALRAFWPATGWPDDQRAEWAYRFTTTPSGFGIWTIAAGVLMTVVVFMAIPTPPGVSGPASRAMFFLAYAPSLLIGYGTFLVAAIQTIRQLRLVARIHREARAIDPFDRVPVYAFSRLTMQIGLAYIVVGYFALTVNGSWQFGSVASLITLATTFGIAIAAFIVPLWGIHGRLVHEKEILVQGSERRLNRLTDEIYARIDGGNFDGTKLIADSVAGAQAIRERIDHLPTWPWPPQVLRGFLSALFLPVVVYVVSRIISNGFGA
jgi:hypothetical protein